MIGCNPDSSTCWPILDGTPDWRQNTQWDEGHTQRTRWRWGWCRCWSYNSRMEYLIACLILFRICFEIREIIDEIPMELWRLRKQWRGPRLSLRFGYAADQVLNKKKHMRSMKHLTRMKKGFIYLGMRPPQICISRAINGYAMMIKGRIKAANTLEMATLYPAPLSPMPSHTEQNGTPCRPKKANENIISIM